MKFKTVSIQIEYGDVPLPVAGYVFRYVVDSQGNVKMSVLETKKTVYSDHWTVSQEVLDSIEGSFSRHGFLSFPNIIESSHGATDCSTHEIKIELPDGRSHMVNHYQGFEAPEALNMLEQELDRLLDTWGKMKEFCRKHLER